MLVHNVAISNMTSMSALASSYTWSDLFISPSWVSFMPSIFSFRMFLLFLLCALLSLASNCINFRHVSENNVLTDRHTVLAATDILNIFVLNYAFQPLYTN
jgi:hypothetical protein